MTDHERITAADVRVGDRIARTRKGPFLTVTRTPDAPGGYIEQAWSRNAYLQAADASPALAGFYTGRAASAALEGFTLSEPCDNAGRIRPRATAKLWREV